MDKHILITGGAGFIGTTLSNILIDQGHRVTVLDNFYTGKKQNISDLLKNSSFDLIEADVCTPLSLKVDQIYHLACPASPIHYQKDPIATTRTCVLGTLNMLELATQNQCPILHASTSEVYGDPLVHPQTESYWGNVNPIGIRSCYDEGKRCSESLCMDFYRKHHTPVWIARIFNTYGPHMSQNDGRIVSNFINQALKSQPLTVHGDGSQTRSFCYVDDLVHGLIGLINTSKPHQPQPFNIGNPVEISVLEIAEIIIKLTNSKSTIDFLPLPSDDPERRKPNIDRIQHFTGYQPKYELEKGLLKTIEYFDHLAQGEIVT